MYKLRSLGEDGLSASILKAANSLWDYEATLLAQPEEPEAERLERKALCGYSRDIGTYCYYLATVLEFFSTPHDEKVFRVGGEIDQLAIARQSLEVNRSVALSVITTFRRNSQHMTVPAWADRIVAGDKE